MGWVFLGVAIVVEVFATTCLKLSDGFSRLWPSVGVVVGYLAAFAMLSLALKTMQVGTAYAVWAGVGTALVAIVGVLAFAEPMGWLKALGLLFIIGGVVLLNVSGAN